MNSLPKQLDELCESHPDGIEARAFLINAGLMFHAIDDLVDGDIPSNPEVFGSILIMAINVYSSNFYNKYQNILYHVIRNIHHTFFDTVKMERDSILWQKEHADILKSVGIDLTLTVIEILGGYEKRRALSIAVREFAYEQQNKVVDIKDIAVTQ